MSDQMKFEPRFSTTWEREDYERQKRGESPLGPLGTGAPRFRSAEATSEMVKRAALVIEATMFAPHEMPLSDALHAKYIETARAAIGAMREPTFDPETVSYHEGMTRADWWRAMIDAALVSERGAEE